MDNYRILKEKIENKKAKICVVGLGYVGLPLAVAFARQGYAVYGLDKNISRIEKLKKGEKYIVDISPAEVLSLIKKGKFAPGADVKVLSCSDVVIICVPTPLRKVKIPDISYVVDAAKTIAKFLKRQQLIVLESTSPPTTTRKVVLPILEKSGLRPENDFFLCFSPERVNPADKKFPVTKITKVVGGLSQHSTALAKALYSKIIKQIVDVSSPETAETVKLLENTFRLVNVALANEFAIVCNKLGISVWEVIAAAKTKPFGFMAFYPGPGLGGDCIPVTPLFFSWKAKKLGFKTRMIDLASHVNRFMPVYVVHRLEALLKKNNISLNKAKILVLGVTYKKDVKDIRESPALEIIKHLQIKGAKVNFYDPLIPYLKISSIDLKSIKLSAGGLKGYDCATIVTDHSSVDYAFIAKNAKLVFDARNVYKKSIKNVTKL